MLLLNNLKYIIAIPLLIFIQVAVFNNINFWGYANPFFYIIFVLLYPMGKNRYGFLLLAFILGLSIDFLENTGGVNAFATVFVAYIRYYLAKLIHPSNTYENDDVQLYNFKFIHWLIYLSILIFVHHFMVDFLESFDFSMFLDIAIKTSIGSLLTLILVTVYLIFFPIESKTEY